MSSGVHTFFAHCEWEEGGENQLWVTKALEIREVQSKVWTSPNWTSWQRSNREGLAPLTKKQYSGTWTLDKGAIERVCAAEWLRRLSEGFGQGERRSSWKSTYTLFLTVWTVRLLGTQLFKTVAWQSSASIQADHRESGDQQKTGDQQNKYMLWNLS